MKSGISYSELGASRPDSHRQASSLSLFFSQRVSPELIRTEFTYPTLATKLGSHRGKGISNDGDGSFQWTAAVQALSVLMIRSAVSQLDGFSPEIPAKLVGEKGSLAASLDYAMDKQPNWLVEMFGVDSQGASNFRRLVDRNNSGCKYAGPVSITVRPAFLQERPIRVFLNDEPITSHRDLIFLLRELEKACGALDCTSESLHLTPDPTPLSPKREAVEDQHSIYRTPLVKLPTTTGDLNIKVYDGDSCVALVGIYGDLNDLRSRARVQIRVHSACVNSDVLGTTDCDCREQLLLSRESLRKSGGLLIHLNQEGRGAGLYSKFLGMSVSKAHALSSYEAYKSLAIELDGRHYEIVRGILKDLGISAVSLMTNNQSKIAALRELGIDVTAVPLFAQLTPQNFEYLYSKYHEGGHNLQGLFARPEEIYLMKSHALDVAPTSCVWIFDSDDTLWEDNIYYEDFIRKFTDRIIRAAPDISRSEVRELLDQVEEQTVKEIGYGPVGFERSLRQTFAILNSRYAGLGEVPNDLISAVVPTLMQAPTVLREGARELLLKLRSSGDIIVLSMQGPIEFQFAKLYRSRSADLFDAIIVSKNKGESTLRLLMSSIGCSPQFTTVVANNLLGDVIPAISLGMRAFHYRNPTSWQILNRTEDRDGYPIVHSFDEVWNIRSSSI